MDRTQLILEIFGRNARTREAKLQIELAQSEYLLPRLLGMWKHLDRERGGIGVSRGTGEKQIEKDRQILRRKIAHLKEDLQRVDRERHNQKSAEFMPTSQPSWLYQRRKIDDHECIDQLRFAR